MLRGERKRNTVLTQVVARRHLATEAIAPVGNRHFRCGVLESVHEYGHVEARKANGVGNGTLVSKVRKRDQDAVDFVPMGFE